LLLVFPSFLSHDPSLPPSPSPFLPADRCSLPRGIARALETEDMGRKERGTPARICGRSRSSSCKDFGFFSPLAKQPFSFLFFSPSSASPTNAGPNSRRRSIDDRRRTAAAHASTKASPLSFPVGRRPPQPLSFFSSDTPPSSAARGQNTDTNAPLPRIFP